MGRSRMPRRFVVAGRPRPRAASLLPPVVLLLLLAVAPVAAEAPFPKPSPRAPRPVTALVLPRPAAPEPAAPRSSPACVAKAEQSDACSVLPHTAGQRRTAPHRPSPLTLAYGFRPFLGPVAVTFSARAEAVPGEPPASPFGSADRADLLDPEAVDQALAVAPRLELRVGTFALTAQPDSALRMDRSVAGALPQGFELNATSRAGTTALRWRMIWREAARSLVQAGIEHRLATTTLSATLTGARGPAATGDHQVGLTLEAAGRPRRTVLSTVRLGFGVETQSAGAAGDASRAAHVNARLQLRPLWSWGGASGFVAMNARQGFGAGALESNLGMRAGFNLTY